MAQERQGHGARAEHGNSPLTRRALMFDSSVRNNIVQKTLSDNEHSPKLTTLSSACEGVANREKVILERGYETPQNPRGFDSCCEPQLEAQCSAANLASLASWTAPAACERGRLYLALRQFLLAFGSKHWIFFFLWLFCETAEGRARP